jgi:hypothetical protein
MDGRSADRDVGQKLGRNLWMARRLAGYSRKRWERCAACTAPRFGLGRRAGACPGGHAAEALRRPRSERGEAAGRDRVDRTRPSSRRQLRGQEAGMTTERERQSTNTSHPEEQIKPSKSASRRDSTRTAEFWNAWLPRRPHDPSRTIIPKPSGLLPGGLTHYEPRTEVRFSRLRQGSPARSAA